MQKNRERGVFEHESNTKSNVITVDFTKDKTKTDKKESNQKVTF